MKLDELIRSGAGKNLFVGIEHMADEDIERLRDIIEKWGSRQHDANR